MTELTGRPTRGYWAIRTDRLNRDLIFSELKEGRLRQGWGWDSTQNLMLLEEKRARREPFTDIEKSAWRNRPMMAFQPGDILLMPSMPGPGQFLLAKVTGPYRFEPLKLRDHERPHTLSQDYGHVVPVELAPSPFSTRERLMRAGLSKSLTARRRIWSLAANRNLIDTLWATEPSGPISPEERFEELVVDALTRRNMRQWLGTEIVDRFCRADFEAPCLQLLKHLLPEANVEHRGGRSEKGADIVVHWTNPLAEWGGNPPDWGAVFQVKSWTNTAYKLDGIKQLQQAVKKYRETQPVDSAYLLTLCDGESPEHRAARARASKEDGHSIPFVFVSREEITDLLVQYAQDRMDEIRRTHRPLRAAGG